MKTLATSTRREMLLTASTVAVAGTKTAHAAEAAETKTYRIGVISASIHGKRKVAWWIWAR